MIKVVCIENGGVNLTNHKVYDVELSVLNEWGDEFYRIRNDSGYLIEYSIKRFILLAELREQQIKIVLDD